MLDMTIMITSLNSLSVFEMKWFSLLLCHFQEGVYLGFYVTAVDQLMKGEGDNPTVGLVICKSTDKTVVEWSLKDICKPLGVATYQLEEVVERTVREIELGNQSNHQ